jgi:glycosyltransferase involved in cell wall biosynthesis
VVIDARIPRDEWGGIQQVVEGLAHGLSQLDGPDEFIFVTGEDGHEWLGPRIGSSCRLETVPRGYGKTRPRLAFEAISRRAPRASRRAGHIAARLPRASLSLPRSNGYLESLMPQVVHFIAPQAVLTDVPSIYQPHDLLHHHHPELLTPLQVRYRKLAYPAFSRQAFLVATMTEWGRHDLVSSLGLPASRIAVVPWAPVADLATGTGNVWPSRPAGLPDRFMLYPAQTWPHKNHLALLEALATLNERGLVIPVVFTGRQNEQFGAIQRRMEALALADQVRFLGFVSTETLQALYRAATALVFPSLFEGWGLPVVEAFRFGLPVVCSDATVLPEVAQDAALYFDASKPSEIAAAMQSVWFDAGVRERLIERGRARVASLRWDRTAKTFRSLYRLIVGMELSDEDRVLLAPPTLVQ